MNKVKRIDGVSHVDKLVIEKLIVQRRRVVAVSYIYIVVVSKRWVKSLTDGS